MQGETRRSLILRLANRDDHEAWSQFNSVYRQFVYLLAMKRGLQPADGDEVVQAVFTNVSAALQKRPHDWEKAKFRTWLYRITFNAIANFRRSIRPDQGTGGSTATLQFESIPQCEFDPLEYDEAFEKSVFEWAAKSIQQEFQTSTWEAFWLTAVSGLTCETTANRLGLKVGSVYAARSRVIRRLREKVKEFDESCQID